MFKKVPQTILNQIKDLLVNVKEAQLTLTFNLCLRLRRKRTLLSSVFDRDEANIAYMGRCQTLKKWHVKETKIHTCQL